MPNNVLRDHFRGYRHPFLFGVHYLGGIGDNPRTLTELAMIQYSAELRQQSEWWCHYRDPIIRAEWAGRALGRMWKVPTPSGFINLELSQRQVDYVLDELSGYVSLRNEKHGCQVSCFDRIWESHSVLDPVTHTTLQSQIHELGSQYITSSHLVAPKTNNGLTTTLVDPSLFCFVYGRTLVSQLHQTTQPRVLPPPPSDIYTASSKFQLLPSQVSISADGRASFTSYINNLHPDEYLELYKSLETTLTGLIPLFEHTLTDLHRNNPLKQRITGACKYTVWDEPEEPDFSDDEEGWSNYERDMRQWVMSRPLTLPDVPDEGYPGGLEERRHIVSLKGRDLQIITNIAETTLQPEGPSFQGTPWHVEGMRNERIIACGFYVVSAENITTASLQFRMAVTYPRGFVAGDTGATIRTWGLQDGDPCHQHIGEVSLQPGFAIVFPNIYQHRLAPFSLQDPSLPGKLTILSFFLSDPDVLPITSTKMVSPQQEEWVRKALWESKVGKKLPSELIEHIISEVDGLMSGEEACKYREELREVREAFRKANDDYHFCIPFDVWNGPENSF